MTRAIPSWFRRHRLAVRTVCAAAVLIPAGYALFTSVQRVRTAASRSADL